jgi:type II secretory pathway component PulF
MSHYRCFVSDSKGRKSEILKETGNERELSLSFFDTGYYLISCEEIAERDLSKTKKHFNKNVILEFTDIMATLLRAGLTLRDALELCVSISANSRTALLSRSILERLNQGTPFNQILKMYSSSFSPLYCSLIRLGEKTGSVAGVFARMSAYLHAEKKLRWKLGNVLWYPFLVLATAIAGCFGIIFYVMPGMTDIFTAFNPGAGSSPVPGLENVYQSLWICVTFFSAFAAAFVIGFALYRTLESFAVSVDALLLSLPLAGPFITSLQTLDFSFAMEMLTSSGIPVSSALQESAFAAGNRAYRNALLAVHEKLFKGEVLSRAFLEQKIFPEYIGTWIAVGEKTGSVETSFSQIRSFFQNDVENGSERLLGMIEPVMTLLIGLIVLVLVVQFVLPIFSLYGRIL